MKKSIFGLDENIASLLCYLFAFFSGIAILIMEKENKVVRFHALQSTIWFLFILVVSWLLLFLSGIPLLGLIFSLLQWLLNLLSIASAIFLMYMAYKGNMFKLPVIGDVVWAQVNK
jgi:uncharacterized membrane protein